MIDSLVGGNIAVFTGEEKYNEAAISTINRVTNVLEGKADPGGPVREETQRKRTFKTKEETAKTKTVTGTVVATLLIIAFIVPMLQYYGALHRDDYALCFFSGFPFFQT